MSDAFFDFDTRVRRINQSRMKLANGYVSVVGDDGLIVVKPRRRPSRAPLRGMIFLVIGFIAFKVMILAFLGLPVYGDRIETLRAGSTGEQAGAWAMQADPLTVMLADRIRPYLP